MPPLQHHNHPEADERAPVIPATTSAGKAEDLVHHGKHWSTYPPRWVECIMTAAEIQGQLRSTGALDLNWTDEDFCRGSDLAGKWPSLRRGLYPYPKTPKTRAELTAALAGLVEHAHNHLLRVDDAARRQRMAAVATQFVELPDYAGVRAAIRAASAKIGSRGEDEERLVVFKARTRGGKTFLADKLMEEGLVTWKVVATPCWKTSYKALLQKLADLTGIRAVRHSVLDLETAVLAHLQSLSGVLLFEEVQALCSLSQEFIKTVLNQTNLVVCIFITNEAHDDLLGRGGNSLAQLFARAEATLPASPITPDIVRMFAPDLWQHAAHDGQLQRVADTANELGALSAVRRICAMIRADLGTRNLITDAMVADAVADYRAAVPLVQTVQRLQGAKSLRKAA